MYDQLVVSLLLQEDEVTPSDITGSFSWLQGIDLKARWSTKVHQDRWMFLQIEERTKPWTDQFTWLG